VAALRPTLLLVVAPRWHDLEQIYVAMSYSRRDDPLSKASIFNVWLIYDD
jgi:hypothetical protein